MYHVSGPLTVLVVDDDAFSRRLLVDSLRKKQFHVLEACDGAEALDAARQHGPSLVITDWIMPEIDGLELCKRLRDDEGIAYTYIVMLTAQSDQCRILEAFAAGADDYITKPFHEEELISRLLAADRIIRLEASHNQHHLQLHKVNAQMASMNDRLQRLTAQLERTGKEAAELRYAAEQANLAKGEFLANVSHELRTPLTAVIGYAEMLQDDQVADDPGQRREAVETIIRNGKRLLAIVDEMLEQRMIDSGQFKVDWSEFDPAALIDEVRDATIDRAMAKSISLTASHAEDLPAVIRSDRRRLRQILFNLTSNALKFTHAGSVNLAVRTGAEASSTRWLLFEVIDTGIGISEHQLEVIFKPFVQGDSSSSRSFGGTGLGLSICRFYAEALGGDLTVQSVAGQGSAFTLKLPIASSLHNAPAQVNTAVDSNDATGALLRTPLYSGTVLLVEDDLYNQRLLQRILQDAGLEVESSIDGRTALRIIEPAPGKPAFDLVIMDVHIPILNGQSVVRLLRRRGYRGKVLALTTGTSPEEVQGHLDAGFDAVLTKPVHRRALLDAVSTYLVRATPVGR